MKHINFKLIHFPFVILQEFGPTPPPIETYFLLLESGDNFITESGDFLIIEDAP